VPAGKGFPGDQINDINVFRLRFCVAEVPGDRERTRAGPAPAQSPDMS
jgi:hypothetical protein